MAAVWVVDLVVMALGRGVIALLLVLVVGRSLVGALIGSQWVLYMIPRVCADMRARTYVSLGRIWTMRPAILLVRRLSMLLAWRWIALGLVVPAVAWLLLLIMLRVIVSLALLAVAAVVIVA